MNTPLRYGIQIFARAPRPGRCKTRLIPKYGAIGAAHWYRRLLEHSVAAAANSAADRIELWGSPDTGHPVLRALLRRYEIQPHRQPSGSLGTRMLHALNDARRRRPGAWLLIGTDCPDLTPSRLDAAATALSQSDCVLQAALDGGYVLIGSRVTLPAAIFNGIAWSSGQEYRQTLGRLRRAGFRVAELPALQDVDHPQDLRAIKSRLTQTSCLRTLQVR